MSSEVSLKDVRIGDSVAVEESKWKLLTAVGDTVFIQDAVGQKFRYRLADVSKGNSGQLKGGRTVIIPPSAANITSAAPLPNGDIVCLTTDSKLKIFGQNGTSRRELPQKGGVIATQDEHVLVLEDSTMITLLNPDTHRYQDAIILSEKVVDITPIRDDFILASLRSGVTVAVSHHPGDEGSTQNFTMTPISAQHIAIKKCLRGPNASALMLYVKEKDETDLWIAMLDSEYRLVQDVAIRRFSAPVRRVNANMTSSGVLVCHVIISGATSEVIIGQLEFEFRGVTNNPRPSQQSEKSKYQNQLTRKKLWLSPEINVWTLCEKIPFRRYTDLGIHLEFGQASLENIEYNVKNFPEITFSMLLTWARNFEDEETASENLRDVLQSLSLWENGFAREEPEDPSSYTVLQTNSDAPSKIFTDIQISHIAAEVPNENAVPVALRLGLKYIKITSIRSDHDNEVTRQKFKVLKEWQKSQTHDVDQARTMANVLLACKMTGLSKQVRERHLKQDDGVMKVVDEDARIGTGDTYTTSFDVRHKDVAIQTEAEELLGTAFEEVATHPERTHRCLEAVKGLQRIMKDDDYYLSGIRPHPLQLHVDVQSMSGLENLMEKSESGDFGSQVGDIFIPPTQIKKKNRKDTSFQVVMDESSYNHGKSFFKESEIVPLEILSAVAQDINSPNDFMFLCFGLNLDPYRCLKLLEDNHSDYHLTSSQLMQHCMRFNTISNVASLRNALNRAGLKKLALKHLGHTSGITKFQAFEESDNTAEITRRALNGFASRLSPTHFFRLGRELDFPKERLDNFLHETKNDYTIAMWRLVASWKERRGSQSDASLLAALGKISH